MKTNIAFWGTFCIVIQFQTRNKQKISVHLQSASGDKSPVLKHIAMKTFGRVEVTAVYINLGSEWTS
jgi:hypothetical protein